MPDICELGAINIIMTIIIIINTRPRSTPPKWQSQDATTGIWIQSQSTKLFLPHPQAALSLGFCFIYLIRKRSISLYKSPLTDFLISAQLKGGD